MLKRQIKMEIKIGETYLNKEIGEVITVLSLLSERACIVQKENGMHIFVKKENLEEISK